MSHPTPEQEVDVPVSILVDDLWPPQVKSVVPADSGHKHGSWTQRLVHPIGKRAKAERPKQKKSRGKKTRTTGKGAKGKREKEKRGFL